MASKLLPFRQISENDVVNLFAYNYAGTTVERGLLVKLDSSNGWDQDDNLSTESLTSYTNTISDRYGVAARVSTCGSGDAPFGMLMYDVRETDENGEKLIYHPRKAHEMQVSVSGQATPILTKGIVLVNTPDADVALKAAAAGDPVYAGANGALIAHNNAPVDLVRVGTFLGPRSTGKNVLVKLDFVNGMKGDGAATH